MPQDGRGHQGVPKLPGGQSGPNRGRNWGTKMNHLCQGYPLPPEVLLLVYLTFIPGHERIKSGRGRTHSHKEDVHMELMNGVPVTHTMRFTTQEVPEVAQQGYQEYLKDVREYGDQESLTRLTDLTWVAFLLQGEDNKDWHTMPEEEYQDLLD